MAEAVVSPLVETETKSKQSSSTQTQSVIGITILHRSLL